MNANLPGESSPLWPFPRKWHPKRSAHKWAAAEVLPEDAAHLQSYLQPAKHSHIRSVQKPQSCGDPAALRRKLRVLRGQLKPGSCYVTENALEPRPV